jgi:hypothetical protein
MIIPVMPHIEPHSVRDNSTIVGCRFSWSPNKIGSKKLPIVNWVSWGMIKAAMRWAMVRSGSRITIVMGSTDAIAGPIYMFIRVNSVQYRLKGCVRLG